MFIFEVTVVLYFIKILSGSRNFYRLRMTSLTYVNECFHDFMVVNRTPPPPPPVNLVLQHCCKALQSLYCTIRRLFVLFVAYSRTIRIIRRLFADYSYYSSTIRGLFVLIVDYSHYSHYSLHYSSFINCHHEGLALLVLIFFGVNNSIYGSWFLIWELFVHSELF